MFNMELLEQTRQILGDSISATTDLDISKLPTRMRLIFQDCIKPLNENVPDESLLLDLLVKMAQLVSINRTKVSSRIGTTLINVYAMIFMPSGSGKDKPLKMIDKHFMKTFEETFHKKRTIYQDNKLKEIKEEAESKYGARAKAAVSNYIEKSLPRVLVPEISNGTTEGLAALRQVLADAEFGGTFLKISEFSDFISSNNNARLEFLTYIVELFDDGSSLGKVIKSEKETLPVKNVPSNVIMHSSIAKLLETDGYQKLMTMIDRGLARRAFLCYPELEKFYTQQKSDDLKDMFKKFVDKEDRLEQKIEDYQSFWQEAYRGTQFGMAYKLTDEADYFLFAYKKYLEEMANKISVVKDEGYRAEMLGRYWKTLKLAGLIAVWEHPTDTRVTVEDVKAAIYIAELYGQHYKRFYQIEAITDPEKLADYLMDNIGKWINKGMIMKQRFVHKNNFSKWIDETLPESEMILLTQGYKIQYENYTRNGFKIRVIPLEKSDLSKVKVSVSKDLSDNYKTKFLPFEELHNVVTADINYSASEFRDGHRAKHDFIDGNNIVILDIDEGWKLEDAKKFLQDRGLKALIATTKSHQKIKDKKPACDRFRIILPTLTPFHGTAEEFSYMMEEIFKYFEKKPDKGTKDASRMFYGNPGGTYEYLEGNPFNIELFDREPRKIERSIIRKQKGDETRFIRQWFRKEAIPGNRNETLYKARMYAIDNDLDPKEFVRDINEQLSDPLTDKELNILLREK